MTENFKLYQNLWLLFSKISLGNNEFKNKTQKLTKNADFWYFSMNGVFTVLKFFCQ